MEDLFFGGFGQRRAIEDAQKYEPVMYKLVHDMTQVDQPESPLELQRNFLARTERLLRQH